MTPPPSKSGRSQPGVDLVSDRFVVEAERQIVGIAVRAPGGYKFFSTDADYDRLEGQTFARARVLANAIARLNRRLRRLADAGTGQVPAVH
jgi:hypothetical protein